MILRPDLGPTQPWGALSTRCSVYNLQNESVIICVTHLAFLDETKVEVTRGIHVETGNPYKFWFDSWVTRCFMTLYQLQYLFSKNAI